MPRSSEGEGKEGHNEENGGHYSLESVRGLQSDVEVAALSDEIHGESVTWLGKEHFASNCHIEHLVNFFAIVENEHLYKLSLVIFWFSWIAVFKFNESWLLSFARELVPCCVSSFKPQGAHYFVLELSDSEWWARFFECHWEAGVVNVCIEIVWA